METLCFLWLSVRPRLYITNLYLFPRSVSIFCILLLFFLFSLSLSLISSSRSIDWLMFGNLSLPVLDLNDFEGKFLNYHFVLPSIWYRVLINSICKYYSNIEIDRWLVVVHYLPVPFPFQLCVTCICLHCRVTLLDRFETLQIISTYLLLISTNRKKSVPQRLPKYIENTKLGTSTAGLLCPIDQKLFR